MYQKVVIYLQIFLSYLNPKMIQFEMITQLCEQIAYANKQY